MKKFIVFLLLAATASIATPTQAQTIGLVSTTNSLKLDTVSNTGVRVMQTQLTGNKATVTIQVDVTKISGTLGGTIIPVASNDGVKWYANGSASFSVTDVASQGVAFASFPLGWGYYGVQWTGTGTMSGSIKCTLLARTPYQ
jgi:hypothetical protein